jgi:hypothetical protein
MPRRNAKPRNEREQQAKARALATVSLMRRTKGLSLTLAAKKEETDPATVKRYAGSALRQERLGGRYRVTAYDRIARTVDFPTIRGDVTVTIRSSRLASQIGKYQNARQTYRRTGDESALAPFKGKSLRAGGVTYHFITDPAILNRLAEADVSRGEGMYRAIQGGTP